MNQLDYKIKNTLESLQKFGVQGSLREIHNLYTYALSHLEDLENLGLFRLSGTLFSIISFEKIPGLTRFPNIAYYCLTRGTEAIQPVGYINIIQENWKESYAERAKLLLNGGLKLISDRLYIIDNIPRQQAYDFSVLGDMLKLISLGYTSVENWWTRALEDTKWIREKYSSLSDNEIIEMGNYIHIQINQQVYKDLKTYAVDYGYEK